MKEHVVTMGKPERARVDDDRGIRIELIKRRMRLISAGAATCEGCQRRVAAKLEGSPDVVRALCETCAADRALDRRINRMRAERDRMRRR